MRPLRGFTSSCSLQTDDARGRGCAAAGGADGGVAGAEWRSRAARGGRSCASSLTSLRLSPSLGDSAHRYRGYTHTRRTTNLTPLSSPTLRGGVLSVQGPPKYRRNDAKYALMFIPHRNRRAARIVTQAACSPPNVSRRRQPAQPHASQGDMRAQREKRGAGCRYPHRPQASQHPSVAERPSTQVHR